MGNNWQHKMKKVFFLTTFLICAIAFCAFTIKPNNNDSLAQSGKRIVTLCTIEGHGSNKTVECDQSGAFYYETETDWEGKEVFVSGQIVLIVNGTETDRKYPVYKNPYTSGVKGNYEFKAGKYYFN